MDAILHKLDELENIASSFAKFNTRFFIANKLGAFFARDAIVFETSVSKDAFITNCYFTSLL